MGEVLLNGGFEIGTPGSMATSWTNPAMAPTYIARSTVYSGLYAHYRPNPANGYMYVLVQAGTTAAVAPSFSTTTGVITTDGTAKFQCAGSSTGTCVIDDTVYRSGTQSLRFQGPGYIGALQDVTVKANKKYSMTCYMKQNSIGILGEEEGEGNYASALYYYISINNTSAYSPVFTGTGLNDCTLGGTYTYTVATTYQVQIDSVSPGNGFAYDTFKWRKGADAWITGVQITGATQTLSYGITATFGATTGHRADDLWYANVGWRDVAYKVDNVMDYDWVKFYIGDFVTITNDTTLRIQVKAQLADASQIWVDDFSVIESDIETPDSTRKLIYSDADYTMFAAHQQDDVFQTDAAPSGDSVTEITINAVANERVSWQFVVNPAAEWTNVTWDCTDFESGANIIDANDLIINRVEYIDVGVGVKGNPQQRTGKSPEALPIEASSTLTAEVNNTFFFTVHVPSDAKAGTYTGTLTLVKDGAEKASIDVEIVVADVLLPLEPYVRSQCGIYITLLGAVPHYYVIEENFWNHRSFKNGHTAIKTFSYSGGHYTFDGSYVAGTPPKDFDGDCTYFAANMPGYVPQLSGETHRISFDANTVGLQSTFNIIDGNGNATPEFSTYYPVYLQDLMAYYETFGIQRVVYVNRDESGYTGASADKVKAITDAIKAAGVNIETWANHRPAADWPDQLDGCWTSVYRLPNCKSITDEFTYPGIYANSFLVYIQNHQPIKIRLFCWALFKDGYKGNQFWTVNAGSGTPWTGNYAYPTLIYPPRAGVDEDYIPINSTRWEAYRQGLQDADLLWTLHDLIETKTGSVASSYITAAQAALDRVDEVVTHLPIYTTNATYGCHYDQFCTQDLALVEEVRAGVVVQIKALNNASSKRRPLSFAIEMGIDVL